MGCGWRAVGRGRVARAWRGQLGAVQGAYLPTQPHLPTPCPPMQGSATLSMAYAGALFADACLRGLNGDPDGGRGGGLVGGGACGCLHGARGAGSFSAQTPPPSLHASAPPVVECTYVASTVTELPFFSSKVKLGRNGESPPSHPPPSPTPPRARPVGARLWNFNKNRPTRTIGP